MSSYFTSVQAAFLLFPFIALLMTLPYILFQYHKFGSIPLLRTTVIYSFVLYLIIIYFLVILPLPSIEEVKLMTTPFAQWIPFHFILDFLKESGFVLTNLSTYLPALKHASFYTVLFNVFLFVPLGIYLRYYFRCGFWKTVLICFLVSLFFEVTQLSGLYGIYPRPYRLFDVDDLIINTVGGMLGFLISPILHFILPSRETLDELSYEKGKQISFFRRSIAFFIDLIFLLFFNTILYLFGFNDSLLLLLLSSFLYYAVLPYLTRGRTLGKFAVQIKITTINGETPKSYQYLLRYFFLYVVLLPAPFYLYQLYRICPGFVWYQQIVIVSLVLFLLIIYLRFCFEVLGAWILKKDRLLYERWSHTVSVSTIVREQDKTKEEIEKSAEKRYNKTESNKI